MTTGKLAAWGFRLRAPGASARQAYSSACLDVARVASEVGVVPDNLFKEQSAFARLRKLRRDKLNILQTVVSTNPKLVAPKLAEASEGGFTQRFACIYA